MSFCGTTKIAKAYYGTDQITHGYCMGNRIDFDIRPFPMFLPSGFTSVPSANISVPYASDDGQLDISEDGETLYLSTRWNSAPVYAINIADGSVTHTFVTPTGSNSGIVVIEEVLYVLPQSTRTAFAFSLPDGNRQSQYDFSVPFHVTTPNMAYDRTQGLIHVGDNDPNVRVFEYGGHGNITYNSSLNYRLDDAARAFDISHGYIWYNHFSGYMALAERSGRVFSGTELVEFSRADGGSVIWWGGFTIWGNTLYVLPPRDYNAPTTISVYTINP